MSRDFVPTGIKLADAFAVVGEAVSGPFLVMVEHPVPKHFDHSWRVLEFRARIAVGKKYRYLLRERKWALQCLSS